MYTQVTPFQLVNWSPFVASRLRWKKTKYFDLHPHPAADQKCTETFTKTIFFTSWESSAERHHLLWMGCGHGWGCRNWMEQTEDWWTSLIWLQGPALEVFPQPWPQPPIQQTPHSPFSLPTKSWISTWLMLPKSSPYPRTTSCKLMYTLSASCMIKHHDICIVALLGSDQEWLSSPSWLIKNWKTHGFMGHCVATCRMI